MTEGCGVIFPVDYYLWSEEWADEMFVKGYLAGKDNEARINEVFNNVKY